MLGIDLPEIPQSTIYIILESQKLDWMVNLHGCRPANSTQTETIKS